MLVHHMFCGGSSPVDINFMQDLDVLHIHGEISTNVFSVCTNATLIPGFPIYAHICVEEDNSEKSVPQTINKQERSGAKSTTLIYPPLLHYPCTRNRV